MPPLMKWSLWLVAITVTVLVLAANAHAACPATQPLSIVTTNGKLYVCATEALTSANVQKDGGVPVSVPGPFVAGTSKEITGVTACSSGIQLRVQGVNAAGPGAWGPDVAATFPPCAGSVYILANPLP